MKDGGRSFTRRMPRELGPKASWRIWKGTVLAIRSWRETVTGDAVMGVEVVDMMDRLEISATINYTSEQNEKTAKTCVRIIKLVEEAES